MLGYMWLGGQGWGSGAGLGCAMSTHAGTETDEAGFNFTLFHTPKGRDLSHLPKAAPVASLNRIHLGLLEEERQGSPVFVPGICFSSTFLVQNLVILSKSMEPFQRTRSDR